MAGNKYDFANGEKEMKKKNSDINSTYTHKHTLQPETEGLKKKRKISNWNGL